jgi:IS4 transposase
MHFYIYMVVHGQVYTNCNANLAFWLVRKDIDVNDYGRLHAILH